MAAGIERSVDFYRRPRSPARAGDCRASREKVVAGRSALLARRGGTELLARLDEPLLEHARTLPAARTTSAAEANRRCCRRAGCGQRWRSASRSPTAGGARTALGFERPTFDCARRSHRSSTGRADARAIAGRSARSSRSRRTDSTARSNGGAPGRRACPVRPGLAGCTAGEPCPCSHSAPREPRQIQSPRHGA